MRRGAISVCVVLSCVWAASCSPQGPHPAPDEERDPLATTSKLLEAHGLVGRTPDQRSPAERDRPIDKALLRPLFSDLDDYEPFIADIYVGFVVGALAEHQKRLFVSRQGLRSRVSAGQLDVQLKLEEGRWRIILAETIPEVIKKRAAAEKQRVVNESLGRAGSLSDQVQ